MAIPMPEFSSEQLQELFEAAGMPLPKLKSVTYNVVHRSVARPHECQYDITRNDFGVDERIIQYKLANEGSSFHGGKFGSENTIT